MESETILICPECGKNYYGDCIHMFSEHQLFEMIYDARTWARKIYRLCLILDSQRASNQATISQLRTKLEELQPGIEKVEEISEQFRCGMAGYELGSEIDDKPHGDAWRVGYAWAAYYDLTTSVTKGKREIAELRRKLAIAKAREDTADNLMHQAADLQEHAHNLWLSADRLLFESQAENAALRCKLDEASEIAQKISNWCNAYPLDMFPEPDLSRARELLAAGGMTLDSISASSARHVIDGIRGYADKVIEILDISSCKTQETTNTPK